MVYKLVSFRTCIQTARSVSDAWVGVSNDLTCMPSSVVHGHDDVVTPGEI